jgi:hypothetical protein
MTWLKILQLAAYLLWPILLFGLFWLVKHRKEVALRIEKYKANKQ